MDNTVLAFAKEELEKYLKILNISADISLGLFEKHEINLELEDQTLDDAYVIEVNDTKGYILGSNERSVLLGVYRLFEELGVSWVRPGPNGTSYPENPIMKNLKIKEKAYQRHRTMCIEGAISFENVLDMIEWMPKVGFNGYFIQFEDALTFFQRWYKHLRNPYKEGKPLTQDDIDQFMKKLVKEIKKRGLMLHRKGHGWHNLAFGMSEDPDLQPKPEEIPQSYLELCAMKDGKRELFNNSPFLTQLCYSNPVVINSLADAVADYAQKNTETDYIHYWLSDQLNNTCECDECTKKTCSDHYINIVNEITDRFVARNIKAKLVPLIYLNAIYVPKETELRNPQCVLFGFAPITRTFADTFPENFRRTTAPEYELNNFKKPLDIDENLSHLYTWEQKYGGEYVDFDYHLMWDFMLDSGGERMAKVISTDIKNSKSLGLNGYISCQLQRNAFPTSLGMTVMAKTLWNNEADFEEIRTKLYNDTFGIGYADKLKDYFATLSESFDFGILKEEKPCDDILAFKTGIEKAIKTMDDFADIINEHTQNENPCQQDSWKYLNYHREIYTLFAKAIIARIDQKQYECDKLLAEAYDIGFKNEDFLQPVFDTFFFPQTVKYRFRLAKKDLADAPLN